MKQYIDKSTLVAEIKRLIDCCYKICAGNLDFLQKSYLEHYYSIETYKEILSFIDTLEVKDVKEPTDAFIEKTEKWIDNFLSESTLIDYKVTPIVRNAVIENFKNYIKGE